MKLLGSAWDGDIEGVKCALSRGVPVDVTILVRSMKIVILYNIMCAHNSFFSAWVDCTADGISKWTC